MVDLKLAKIQFKKWIIPNVPKAPSGPFALFVKENAVKGPVTGAIAEISQKWKAADQSSYQEQARQLRQEYETKLKQWEQQLTIEDKLAIEEKRSLSKILGKRFSIPSYLSKRPANAYALFVKSRPGQGDPKTRMTQLASEWKALSQEEKSVFQRDFEQQRKEYEQQTTKLKKTPEYQAFLAKKEAIEQQSEALLKQQERKQKAKKE
ncbi:hypothetical protein EDD86DRAFT_275797 [Gorgonomyces haynaldii]|nr:hypothetical protein EDD86DRAFT_275797 [Gorgonomyces haynaldii]